MICFPPNSKESAEELALNHPLANKPPQKNLSAHPTHNNTACPESTCQWSAVRTAWWGCTNDKNWGTFSGRGILSIGDNTFKVIQKLENDSIWIARKVESTEKAIFIQPRFQLGCYTAISQQVHLIK